MLPRECVVLWTRRSAPLISTSSIWRCEASSSFRQSNEFLEPPWSLLIRASGLGQPGKTGEYDTSVSLDLQSLFPVLRLLKDTRGEGQLLIPFSYTQATKEMENALKQLRCQQLQITPYVLQHGGASEECAVNARSLEVQKRGGWKSFNSVRRYEKHARFSWLCPNPTRTDPARADTRTRPGTTLEKASARALTGPTLSVGRVFFCICNTAHRSLRWWPVSLNALLSLSRTVYDIV